ncbi:polysaccharide pyruvyl transferase family protein [Clostridium estertheticum]|uniref:polysaccharide pyruvyl transferase family protein n=1 Tax=Clostridium estertheticum TaxID=238834 RepID=UPI0013EE661A|nr:polysaccharide pyruvyl transferase family protein [Clostridium estertheticum]MBZ9609337.1 polysaccharide pyruvyl transferase family protein [Clostridium estertheticum]
MVKIGIITYHCAYNYGAVLQAYALQTKLNILGYESEIINFRSSSIVDNYKESKISGGKRAKVYKIIKRKQLVHAQSVRRKRYEAFDSFINKVLNLSPSTYLTTVELENDTLDYNVYICGSDQIWNYSFNGNENAYFLSFVKGNSKKIAYAPSFGIEKLLEEDCHKIKPLLSSFTAISSREEKGIKILNEQLQLDATHVLDPTLLLEPEKWESFASKYKNDLKQKYIFVYIIGSPEIALKRISEFAKKEDLHIKYVGIGSLLQPNGSSIIDKSDIGPEEFIELLMGAEYVCTNSFHGMALSISLNKKFAIMFNDTLNTRMESLLKMCRLEEQKYDTQNTLQKEHFEKIDFEFANNVIEQERKKSIKFLIEAIKE